MTGTRRNGVKMGLILSLDARLGLYLNFAESYYGTKSPHLTSRPCPCTCTYFWQKHSTFYDNVVKHQSRKILSCDYSHLTQSNVIAAMFGE